MLKLKLENINKTFDGKNFVVKNFNLEVNNEDFVVLVGPSGCGKTTVLRCRQRAKKEYVHAHRGETGCERGFKHIARQARILADHDTMAVVTATKDTASRHADAQGGFRRHRAFVGFATNTVCAEIFAHHKVDRSEEHTSELQSRGHLVCRLLLEKKKHLYHINIIKAYSLV